MQGTCRAGGRPAEKTNRCFFFFLLLLLPHRNTHKHPTGGPSYRGGIAAGPGTNPPVGGGVPPCGLVVSEQNADRKCSCRNDSLRRRQTLTTTPSSLLHFRHRRRRRRCCCRSRRHFGFALRRGETIPVSVAGPAFPRFPLSDLGLWLLLFRVSAGPLTRWPPPDKREGYGVDPEEPRHQAATLSPHLPALGALGLTRERDAGCKFWKTLFCMEECSVKVL